MMIRKNDTVILIAGKDKGKTGKILAIYSGSGTDAGRALVEKVNMVKRHVKNNPQRRTGGIMDKEASIHLSNLMIYCSKCKKGVRTGTKVGKDGAKSRVCKKCGESIGQ